MANIMSRGGDVRIGTVQHGVYLVKHSLNLSKINTMEFPQLNRPDMYLEREPNVTDCPPIDNMEAGDWSLCGGARQKQTGNLSHILYSYTRLK